MDPFELKINDILKNNKKMKSKIYITGAAGFIGFHAAKKFLDKGIKVHGFDSINNYYDVNLKRSRLKILKK